MVRPVRLMRSAVGRFFEYDTPKIVHIQSLHIGITYRFVQLVIISYVIGWVLVYKKGYQETDSVESSVTSKVKGVVLTNFTLDANATADEGKLRVWDTADYVIPPQENGAFFVTTNIIMSPNQEQGICAEDHSSSGQLGASCSTGFDCPSGSKSANGVRTGTCNNATSTCAIRAWCPVEKDVEPQTPVLQGTEDFTVLVKNQIFFPKFRVRRRNILDGFVKNASYLGSCLYHPTADPFCPIFRLGDIIALAQENYSTIAVKGAVIGFVIEWECNLDLSVESCLPKYSFRRIDNADDVIAKGWNFRYANYWTDTVGRQSVQRRTLIKAYGIRFVFYVYGVAGKFNIVPLATNLGAGLALLGLAVIFCDIGILYCAKRRQFYSDNKYLTVQDEDAVLFGEDDKSGHSGDNLIS